MFCVKEKKSLTGCANYKFIMLTKNTRFQGIESNLKLTKVSSNHPKDVV